MSYKDNRSGRQLGRFIKGVNILQTIDQKGLWNWIGDGISNLYRDSWLERVIDPTAVEMRYNSSEAEKSREWNAEQNRIAREVQIDLSNTAYSRGIADAQKSGINPYAVYSGGGASVPSITSASGTPASASGSGTSRAIIGALSNVANNVTRANVMANNNATKLATTAMQLLLR